MLSISPFTHQILSLYLSWNIDRVRNGLPLEAAWSPESSGNRWTFHWDVAIWADQRKHLAKEMDTNLWEQLINNPKVLLLFGGVVFWFWVVCLFVQLFGFGVVLFSLTTCYVSLHFIPNAWWLICCSLFCLVVLLRAFPSGGTQSSFSQMWY